MISRPGWNARAAVANLPLAPWTGRAWRFHPRSYTATDSGGSALTSGRYHRAVDQFDLSEVWPALYLAITPEGAVGEVLRHFEAEALPRINDYRLSEVAVELGAVLDCRTAADIGLPDEDFIEDYEFSITQEIAAAAIARGAQAILVPSATLLGDNLVVFPTQLQSTSRLVAVGSRDPRLYVPR